MEQDKNKQAASQNKTNVEKAGNEQGRAPVDTPQSAQETTDISLVDQQEGEMNNGELGGNLNENLNK